MFINNAIALERKSQQRKSARLHLRVVIKIAYFIIMPRTVIQSTIFAGRKYYYFSTSWYEHVYHKQHKLHELYNYTLFYHCFVAFSQLNWDSIEAPKLEYFPLGSVFCCFILFWMLSEKSIIDVFGGNYRMNKNIFTHFSRLSRIWSRFLV